MPHHTRPPRRAPWRGLLRWSAALALVAAAVGGGAELVARSFPQRLPAESWFRLHDNAIKANMVGSLPDDEFGYLWRPNVSERIEGFRFGFDYSTDRHGFRNPEPWPQRADVVVLGDSEAFGFGVEDQQVWTRQLAERMPQQKIVNLGLLGSAPQQFEKIYRAFGRPLRPRFVLVALFPPNMISMARLFDQWQSEGRPDRFDIRRLKGAGDRSLLERVKRSLTGSHAVLGVWYALRSALGLSDLHTMTFDDGTVRLVSSRYGDSAAGAASGRPDFVRVIDILARLQAAVEADGAELIVLPFPTKEEVYLPILGEQPNRLAQPFERALEQRGIETLDLLPALRAGAAAGEDLFFEIDLHPNAAGQQAIAEQVRDALQQRSGESSIEALRQDREAAPRRRVRL
jgi:lysophospholipase L1-like esterase